MSGGEKALGMNVSIHLREADSGGEHIDWFHHPLRYAVSKAHGSSSVLDRSVDHDPGSNRA